MEGKLNEERKKREKLEKEIKNLKKDREQARFNLRRDIIIYIEKGETRIITDSRVYRKLKANKYVFKNTIISKSYIHREPGV